MLNICRPFFPRLNSFSGIFDKKLREGAVTNNGPAVKRFELALTEHLGVPTICFSSGQSALMTMLKASDVEGGVVLCPSFTFCATPNAIVWAGAEQMFTDVDGVCMSVQEVSNVLSHGKVRAVLSVDPYGICCDYKALQTICDSRDVPLLIDSAASFGATYHGIKTGGFGKAQIFSFHATKPFSTMEGGCLCSRDLDFLERCKRIRNFGQDENGECVEVGLNGKMMEICALIGLESLNTWSERLQKRQKNAELLREELDDVEGIKVIRSPPHQEPTWLYQPILIEDGFGVDRDGVITGLKRFDIMARKYYSACHKMTAFDVGEHIQITEHLSERVVSLPVYSDMTEHEIDSIVSALHNIKNGSY